MRLGEKDRKPYQIDIEREKEEVPSDADPSPVRHEPRRDRILRAPIRLRDDGAGSSPERASRPRD